MVKSSDSDRGDEGGGGDKLKLSSNVGAVLTILRDAATFADKTFRDVTNFRWSSSLFAQPSNEFSLRKLVQNGEFCPRS